MNPRDLFLHRNGRFVLMPVVHHSFEFALAVRLAFQQITPAAVALEYPAALQSLIAQGIARLPRISVLIYGSPKRYIRIEPVDPFVEAARLALQKGLEFQCIDAATPYPEVFDPIPDTFAMRHLGHAQYCEMLLRKSPPVEVPEDSFRERSMAYHLNEFAERIPGRKPILVLCGLRHLNGVDREISLPQGQPFEKPPAGARLYHLGSASLGEIMGYFPFLTAVYEKQRGEQHGTTVAPVAPELELSSLKLRLLPGKKTESLGEFATRAQDQTASAGAAADRSDLLARFVFECRRYYEQEIGDEISPHSMLLLQQFARKYASIKGMLLPDFYELLIAGRSCVNSHFCYRMWEMGTFYPPQAGSSEIEIIELRAEDVFALINKVRMNPHPPLKPRATLPGFLRRKDKQKAVPKPDLEFSPYSICSHQPEDLVIESYGSYLRTKGKSLLSEERKKVRPFETSLLDGIDLRETIRNWHTGQLFVQECSTIRGQVSSVVVIFDEDGSKYPHTMTWLGEHYQESDMAFYATNPEDRDVAPGIRKAVYGGFLMTMPPGRLFDVFGDPAYASMQNYAERLLLAGIDYSLEKYVLYAAASPPRRMFQTLAGRYGRRILYVPLAQLSPVMLRKIRTFHILSHKSVRDYAKDYIW